MISNAEMILELREARKEVDKHIDSINKEMRAGTRLQTNSMCEAWPDYEKAYEKLNELRLKYGV